MKTDIKAQIYDTESILAHRIRRVENDSQICRENKDFILQFVEDKRAEGVTSTRLTIIVQHFKRIARLTSKPFASFTEGDLKRLMAGVEAAKWSDWTKCTSRTLIKAAMRKNGWKNEALDWIKNKRPVNKLRSEDLLTADEMNRMVAAASTPMHKAMLAVLFDTGMRPGELLSLQYKDVVRNGTKIKIYAAGKLEKTQGSRVCYVYKGLPLVDAWLALHPQKSPESPLWPTNNNPTSLANFSQIYQRISKNAGITKHNWPYLIRHTKLTDFYRDYGGIIGSKLAGHVVGSKEARTYLHLSESDIEDALDRKNGIKESQREDDLQVCAYCKTQNTYSAIVCASCGKALNSAGALIVEQESNAEETQVRREIDALLNRPGMLEKLQKLLGETGISE